ncbi:MAG: hypothetical protein RL365_291 [Bacteroidota bacterium]|jgi:flagellum-specific peptidoglycan hydrolase FlgJ
MQQRIINSRLFRSILLTCAFFANIAYSQQKIAFFDSYRSLADSLGKEYQIPACVILSVAYLESGGGVSVVAKKLNNHFGIVGDCKYSISKHQSKYKYYETSKDSYIGFCNLVKNKKFYESMKGSTDEHLWFKKIAATGYAADATKWANACSRICNDYCH